MIKFKKLIHKETGIVIEYGNWEKQFKKNEVIVFPAKELGACWKYNSNNILFSDDFEIIYDSEFTTEELELIKESLGYSLDEDLISYKGYDLIKKIDANMESRCK